MWALPSDAVQLLMLNGGKREKTCAAQLVALLKQGFPFRNTLFIADYTLRWRYSGCHCVAWFFSSKVSLQADCLERILLVCSCPLL